MCTHLGKLTLPTNLRLGLTNRLNLPIHSC